MKQNSRRDCRAALPICNQCLRAGRLNHNNVSQEERLPLGTDAEGSYQKRKTKIRLTICREFRKMREQTRKYEDIFKHEFVLYL